MKKLKNKTNSLKKRKKLSEKQIDENITNIAKARIKLALIISEVSKAHNIFITEADVEQHIQKEINKNPSQAKQIREHIKQNPSIKENIKSIVIENKVISFILSKVKYSNIETTPQKWQQRLINNINKK